MGYEIQIVDISVVEIFVIWNLMPAMINVRNPVTPNLHLWKFHSPFSDWKIQTNSNNFYYFETPKQKKEVCGAASPAWKC